MGQSKVMGRNTDSISDLTSDTLLLASDKLSKNYGGVRAVDSVSLSLYKGEILGLVGPNGAGKTTLVDLITGAQTATNGTTTLAGAYLKGSPARRARAGLARTFQHPMLAADLTILETLVAGMFSSKLASPWGMLKGAVRGINGTSAASIERAQALANDLGIKHVNRLCGDLTLGEQRLVEVGRALAQNPTVMLLDEPFAGADANSISGIRRAILYVKSRGHGVILVDHNVDLIADLADRVVLLDQGQMVFDGPPAECLASTEMQTVYFGQEDEK